MSETEGCCVCNVILPSILALIAFFFIHKHRKTLQQKFFAAFFVRMSKSYNRDLNTTKTELFAELKHFKSLDASLRNDDQIRILEIGVGPGSNFKFFPRNARLIAVDPNPYFRQSLEENSGQFPEVNVEQIVLGAGEDLAEVKDGSVDVVVTTIVLCSVRDVEKVLQEIKRVLAPGGKYFFLEHVIGKPGTRYRRLQTILNPIWPTFLDGCHLTRDLGQMIDQAGFSKKNFKHFIAPLDSVFKHVIAPHIVGTVQK